MTVSIFGESAGEIIDLFVKLSPALTIIAGIFAAKQQFRNSQELNQELIAKNHYADMLEVFIQNSDILFLGSRQDSFELLKQDPQQYRKYRSLFAIMGFAMQEIFDSKNLQKNDSWLHMCAMYISLFRCFILSEDDFTPFLQNAINPKFRKFMFESARDFQHPVALTVAAQYMQDDAPSTATRAD